MYSKVGLQTEPIFKKIHNKQNDFPTELMIHLALKHSIYMYPSKDSNLAQLS